MLTKRQVKANIARLQGGLVYRGEVSGVRQTYYIFEAEGSFFVLSFARSESKPGSGYFNVVDAEAVEYVRSRFAGKRAVTAKDVVHRARRTAHAPTSLIALNVLYVLVALGEAEIVQQGENRALVFAMRPGTRKRAA
ncbi:MAG TPA: hypothetical protein VF200_04940 [Woeseiaceae bacterium]